MFNLIFSSFLVLFLHVSIVFSKEKLNEDWIDPYDMSPSKEYLQYAESTTSMHTHNQQSNTLTDIYFKRTINMLLNTVHEDFTDSEMYSGHLFLKISIEEFEFLEKFAEGSDNNIERVNKILENILKKPNYDFLEEYLESWFHKCLRFALSREGSIFIIIATYMFVIIKLFKTNFYSLQLLKFLFINFFIFDFIFTWVHLYQKAQAKDLVRRLKQQELPVACNPEKMNSWQFLSQIFSTEDACVEYYEVRFEDIFYKISPGLVLTEMFARTIQYPAKAIGQSFGEMCFGIYSAFPWPLNFIILPICLIFLCLIICIILFFGLSTLVSKKFTLNFFHLISFSCGGESRQNTVQDSISGRNLKEFLKIKKNYTRPFIQEIPVKEVKSKKKLAEQEAKESKNKEYDRKPKEIIKKIETTKENDKPAVKVVNKIELGAGDSK